MKTFHRRRNYDEVMKLCKEMGFTVNDNLYTWGGDYITIDGTFGGKEVVLTYNTFDGKFFGALRGEDGMVSFTSNDSGLDGQLWYDEILNFVYVAKMGD
ncbi:MAG: hypothetical protein A2516_10810 [Alphaproteobacteria bacterium RIFOXYD12_FULL_60_8]|nr:MAG: hypothetical protein A2516_10810 [Alphaproteobacteria bacterium RIFOXYD12_FULL_60_8]